MGNFSGSLEVVGKYQSGFDELLDQDTDLRVGEGRVGYTDNGCLLILRTPELIGFSGRVISATVTLTLTQNPDFDTAIQRMTADYGNDPDNDTYTGLFNLYDGDITPPDIGSGLGEIEVDITDIAQAALDANDSRILMAVEEDPFDSDPEQGTVIVTVGTYSITTVADVTAAITEPTGSFTLQDLVIEVAREIGTAYYGTDGDEAAQVPTDAHDLAEAKRHINNAIRQVLSDAPPQGWRWAKPVASVVLWPSVAVDDDVTVSGGAYDAENDQTTLEATESTFYPSMETKTITVTDVGDFTIESYASATQVIVSGDASAVATATFSIDADGNYTLPRTFGGVYSGQIGFAADSSLAGVIQWVDEGTIRRMRENGVVSDDPTMAGVRIINGRRRWTLSVWPTPASVVTVEFPYDLYFDKLTGLTDKPPIPFLFDELLRAAVLMIAERDVHRAIDGPHTRYYQQALVMAYQMDSRSAPKRLGYFGDPGSGNISPHNFRDFRSRPTVNFNE